MLYAFLCEVPLLSAKKTAIIGILAAVICVLAPFSFPAGAIPISLTTLAIYIVSCTVSTRYALPAVMIYILLGAAGLPVFSSFTGGFQQIAGLTGGYIIGYIPCSFIISVLTDKFESKKYIYPLSMVLGTLACYAFGAVRYIQLAECGLLTTLTVCVLPFLIGDAVKIVAASCVGITLRKRLKRFI